MKKISLPNIPEFSDDNYSIAGYIVASFITLSGGFLIYEILFNSDLTFSANWNMFRSPLGNLCWFIGFIWAIVWWGKFTHWSATPITKTYDRYGNLKKVEEDYDVSNQMFAKILMPFLGHFVIEPIIYGAIIYYPIQCVIALVGTIFPYVLSLIVLAIMGGSWLFTKKSDYRYHSIILVLLGILFTGAFSWGGYTLYKATPGSTISMLANTSQQTNSNAASDDTQQAQQEAPDSDSEFDDTASATSDFEEDEADQFEGIGEEGLYGSLPNGTTDYTGDMDGYPIEFSITKNDDMGNIKAVYKNVKYGATMELTGESLPADGGNISFFGKDSNNNDWSFDLSGGVESITGTANGDGKTFKVTLHKKQSFHGIKDHKKYNYGKKYGKWSNRGLPAQI